MEILCIYCGEPATVRDHIVPVKYVIRRARDKGIHGIPLVPACSSCNGTLSATVLGSIAARRAFVHARLGVKLRAALRFTIPEEEIARLGKTLRRALQRKLDAKLRAERRLAFSALPYDGPEPDLSPWL